MRKEELIDLLKKDVVPALGCTEPVCVALCAAYASKQLNNPIIKIELDVIKPVSPYLAILIQYYGFALL